MLHSKVIKSIAAIMLVMGIFTACKKDAFSEKDAIAAQTTLLQTKFSYDLAIKQIDLQIQRSGDSAKIVIQNLVNSGATALEILKQTNALAQILQNQTNLLAAYRYQDSLNRNTALLSDKLTTLRALFNDSLGKAQTNAQLAAALAKQYTLRITDVITNQPIVGAVVSVLPVGTSTFATATTDATGTAKFSSTLIVDPASFFIITATNYSTALVQENNIGGIASSSTVTIGGFTYNVPSKFRNVTLYNPANTRNTIRGSVLGDVNLTNGDAAEAISGQLVTFTQNTLGVDYQFSALSDANGNYSVSVPDGFYTPIYSSTVRVQQKLFVNAWTDQDQTAVLPRIDSTGTTLQSYGFPGAFPSSGSGQGYYLTFPSDSLNPTKAVFAANINNFFQPSVHRNFSPQNFTGQFGGSYVNRNAGAPKTDSLGNYPYGSANSLYLNNLTTPSGTDNSIIFSRASASALLPVTFVSLLPGFIVTSPSLEAKVDPNTGKISSIQLKGTNTSPFQPVAGSGGVFNNAVMFTPTNRAAFTNLTGIYGPYLASLATQVRGANDVNPFNVTGGNSYYLPIEYRNTIARDRTPR